MDVETPEPNETEEQGSSNSIELKVSIGTDRDRFLRRNCPSCGRDFKTEIDAADLAWALTAQISRVSMEMGIPAADAAVETEKRNLRCPYCQHFAEANDMHTEETVDYLKRFAYREYALPMLSKMLSEFADSVRMGSSGGLISFSISADYQQPLIPPRPIHGPEPTDMKIVDFLCCNKRIKVAESCVDISQCSFCGSQVSLC